jgi:hypothetical protein
MVVVVLLAFHGTGRATTTVYYDESTFLATNPIVSTETFDEYPEGTGFSGLVVMVDSVFYNGVEFGPDPVLWYAGPLFGPVSPPNTFYSNWSDDNILTFGPDKYVHAIGFWITSGDVAYVPHDEILVKETDGSVSLFDVSFVSSQHLYYGFSSSIGIAQITVRDYAGDLYGWNWSFDNVSRAEIVPEPATVLLLGLGGLIMRRLKFKN